MSPADPHKSAGLSDLRAFPAEQQVAAGYSDTLREIRQQPLLWKETARQLVEARDRIRNVLDGCRSVTLTGSGSSEYSGACVVLPLREELGVPVEAVPAGLILTHRASALQPGRPAVLVSLARSGDSPESCAAVELLLGSDRQVRHLVITCNRDGRLAQMAAAAGATVIVLDERTNDRSLVMTSSFTSMTLAARFLALCEKPDAYLAIASHLSRAAEHLLERHAGALRREAESGAAKVVFLGTGPGAAVARETALKMLEMTAGRTTVLAESFLGLRHGPLALIDRRTMIVAFLSSRPLARAYELDVLSEIARKQPATLRVVVCGEAPSRLQGETVIDCPGLAEAGDANAPIVYAVAGQVLAFFRCLAEGLRPDNPSEGAIHRVVGSFKIHR